ncbi:MAG: prepilin-type N-terminal cleavage/methylation domain-containing protein, partial [Planctomycetes bacterium]|nr:prepilin-type N-terminal cleavage/methylation domain-containing protein [Planctomycetota bacterium]
MKMTRHIQRPASRRRGLTLIELLAAVAILAAISIATSSLTLSATRIHATASSSVRWDAAAHAVFDLIGEDLGTGDLTMRDRVEVTEGVLRITTRSVSVNPDVPGGPAEHTYRLDGNRLVRERRVADARGEVRPAFREPPRLLLADVADWSVAIEGDDDS